MSDPGDDAFVRRAGASLDRSVDALDQRTRAQLAAARRRALSGRQPRARRWRAFAAPAAALAVGLVIAVGIVPWAVDPADDPLPILADGDLDLLDLLAVQDPDELTEDPDFYLWVDEQLSAGDGSDAG
ncbi:MAG: hypothetical protein KDH15_02115 [Rhodocyclaceae bacterium]|nr:hypothetical protein [Rhodocyclaceae bacterium]